MARHFGIFAWRIAWTRSLVGDSPWSCKELGMTEHTHMQAHAACIGCLQPSFSVSLPYAPRSFSYTTVSCDLTHALLTQDSELFCMLFPLPLFHSKHSSFMSQRGLHSNSKGYAVFRIRDAVMGEMGSLENAAGKHPGHPCKNPTICRLQDSWHIPAYL